VINASQIRAARTLLGINQKKLAELVEIPLSTVRLMEASDDDVQFAVELRQKMIAAFRSAGIVFIADNESSDMAGRGVRLRHPGHMLGQRH
jgi:DNA-binding XRE family transcriptional regulator